MAQTGYSVLSLYYSTTASAAPTAGNLVAGELAINTNDGVLYYKDSSGVVQSIASKAGNSGSFTNLAYTGTLTGGTGVVNLGSGQFYKDASGNVGIGTSSPNSAGVNRALTISGTSNSILELNYGSTKAGYLYANSTATILSGVPASGILQFNTVDTERMRIDSSGNVGIGTSSPSSFGKFAVTGSVGTFSVDAGATGVAFSFNGPNYISSKGGSSGALVFETGGANERMRIDSSGNILFGKTSNNVTTAGSFINGANAPSGYPNSLYFVKSISGASNGILNYYAGSYVGGMDFNNTTTSFPTSSDVRLKKDIVDAPSAIDKINDIRIISHGWKNDEATVDYGVIAQELYQVAPLAVSKGDDGEEIVKTWGVDYSKLVPILVKAVQELNAKVDAQAVEIATLKAK